MTLLPVADGARLLGIHPKTLHHWLKEANMPLATHPTDARVKCVTEEHLQQVASLHERPLQASGPLDAASPPLVPSQMSVPSASENQMESASAACSFLTSSGSASDLIQKLSGLETKIATLQEQVAQLTLALLQERERSVEHRLTTLESLMQAFMGRPMSNLPVPQPRQEPMGVTQPPQELHPAEQLARSRRPPLIEYCAPGIYVIISSQEGEVHLEPNSRAWFDWLATLSRVPFHWTCRTLYGPSRLQTGPADTLLVGFSLCAPSYLQALSWHDGGLDHCQSGADRCQAPIGRRRALGFRAFLR